MKLADIFNKKMTRIYSDWNHTEQEQEQLCDVAARALVLNLKVTEAKICGSRYVLVTGSKKIIKGFDKILRKEGMTVV